MDSNSEKRQVLTGTNPGVIPVHTNYVSRAGYPPQNSNYMPPPSDQAYYTPPPSNQTPYTAPPSYTAPPPRQAPNTTAPSNQAPYTAPPPSQTPYTAPPSSQTPYTAPPSSQTPYTAPQVYQPYQTDQWSSYCNPTRIIYPQAKGPYNTCTAYALCLFLGVFGGHHFYLNRPGFGLIYLMTFGMFGLGVLVDLCRIPSLVKHANDRERNINQDHLKKRLDDAYVLWLPLFGLLGFHHFYLRNYKRGVLYFFTLGIFGVGWLLDLCLMPIHVKRANQQDKNDGMKTVADAYAFGITPLGLLGAHHFYLNRPLWGIFYIHTLAGFGIGWIMDWIRMPVLVERRNKLYTEGDFGKRYLDDAYVLWFPCGLLGFHHFYLNRPGWGFLYFFTFGILGIGWLIDFFRLPCLVKEYNRSLSGKVVSPARQGVIVSKPSGTDGGQNTNGQCTQNGYGVTGTTYVIPSASSVYPVLNPGYQTVMTHPPQGPAYHGGFTNQGYEEPTAPPPYTPVDQNAQIHPTQKVDLS